MDIAKRNALMERKLSEANSGRLVEIAWKEMRPIFEAQKVGALVAAMQSFREGNPPEKLVPHVAKLTAIDELEIAIKAVIIKGQKATRETLDA